MSLQQHTLDVPFELVVSQLSTASSMACCLSRLLWLKQTSHTILLYLLVSCCVCKNMALCLGEKPCWLVMYGIDQTTMSP